MLKDGRLLRTWKDGRAKLNAYLDDYAFLANALIDVYEGTSDSRHLRWSIDLVETILAQYWDEEGRGFFLTSRDHESLVTRPMSGTDQSIPSGGSATVFALLRLAAYTHNATYRERAERVLTRFGKAMEDNPFGYANLLCALDWYLEGPTDVVIVGTADHPDTRALLRAAHTVYVPNRTLTVVAPAEAGNGVVPEAARGKAMVNGKPTGYVCRGFTCSAPVTSADALVALLTDHPGEP